MMLNKQIVVSFSSRKNGNCANIARYIDQLEDISAIYSFSDFEIRPCGGCEYECFQDRLNCPYIGDAEYAVLEDICDAFCAYLIVPSYCDFPCANFFIFNERSLCYFQGRPDLLDRYLNVPKKFIVVGNGSEDNFRAAFMQHVVGEPNILVMRSKVYHKDSLAGDLITSEAACEDVRRFVSLRLEHE